MTDPIILTVGEEYMAGTPLYIGDRLVATVWRGNGFDRPALASQMAASGDLLAAAKRALNTFKAQGESVRPGNVLGALEAAVAKAQAR